MKKSITLFVSAVVLSLPCTTALAQMTADSVGGANPRPHSPSIASPTPQSVGGANPRPTNMPNFTETMSTILAIFGVL